MLLINKENPHVIYKQGEPPCYLLTRRTLMLFINKENSYVIY